MSNEITEEEIASLTVEKPPDQLTCREAFRRSEIILQLWRENKELRAELDAPVGDQTALVLEAALTDNDLKNISHFLLEMTNLRLENDALKEEIARLKSGKFTEEEFQNLCHGFDESDFARFCDGCEEYQQKLFGRSRTGELEKRLSRVEAQTACIGQEEE